jgi:DNA mismatch repair protein MutS
LPPLLAQYVALRDEYAEFMLLFQVGDFFEAFGEDAEQLARALGLTLTHKSSRDFVTPMAGMPIRAADAHIERLLKLGYRVAVAEQTEEAGDGLVERQVTQLITPGTVTNENLLRGEENFLAGVAQGDGYALSLLDVSTGEFRCCFVASRLALYDELARYRPAEVLLAPELSENTTFVQEFGARFTVMRSSASFDLASAQQVLARQFGALPASLHLPERALASEALTRACGAVLAYALLTTETRASSLPTSESEGQRNGERLGSERLGTERLSAVRRLLRYDPSALLRLDETAVKSLELFEPLSGSGPTLFSTLNETRTAPGRRRLRAWLRSPLQDAALIEERLAAVALLYQQAGARANLRAALYRAHDLERLAARVAGARANARDLVALARTLELVPEIAQALAELTPVGEAASNVNGEPARLLRELTNALDPVAEALAAIRAALTDDPPLKLAEGGLIRDGFDAELDAHKHTALEGRAWIARLEETERARTGIHTLKVGFNNVTGYYLEITNVHRERVPDDYRQIATLKDRMRFTRPDLRERERQVLHAEERAIKREYQVFSELRQTLAGFAERLQRLASSLADLDVLSTLAELAAARGYVRPSFSEFEITVVEGRHPVVEEALRQKHSTGFVANSLQRSETERLLVITGPNMSGKSTYLRQTALIVIMAQIGSFVPAKSAQLMVFSEVFTRIGASDDLSGGASTFMVEMRELAGILHGAGRKSLVILDEIGRGTSTFDGLAIAWAASEFLRETGALVLFATHYFELTALENRLPGVVNWHVAAQEEASGGLRFYHQVMAGPASKSYGTQVARLAGLPPEVVARAEALLKGFEAKDEDVGKNIVAELLALDVGRLSPLEAMMKLAEWQRQLQKG